MPESLWGDLKELELVRTPKTILKEQAEALTEATSGALVGVVDDRSMAKFTYDLDVRVPTLNNYRYTILTVSHAIELYPLELHAQKPAVDISCENDKDFEAALAKILGSSEVRHVLSRLRSQVI